MTRLLFLTLTLAACLDAASPPAQLSLRWAELGAAIDDSKIALGLPDGTYIQGRVRGVERDGLRLRVTKTSNKSVLAKGERLIPRRSVSVVSVTSHRKLGRILCTAGAVGGAAIAIAAHDIDLYEGPTVYIVPAVAAGGTIGLGVAGYYIGKAIDKRVTIIRVLPD